MFAKLLGLGDLISTIAVVLLQLDVVGWKWGLVCGLYLIIKGWAFRESIMSLLDLLCGIYLLVMMFGLSTFISWFIAVYLFQKACFSISA